jgi:hypothetical protein
VWLCISLEECRAGGKLLDEIFKAFVSGEDLASRPNYGRVTDMVSFGSAAKFWEINKDRTSPDSPEAISEKEP